MNDLATRIDEMIEEKSLLKHPFYQAWTMGSLPVESLRDYASQYYHFEKAYPMFLSGLHYRCSDQHIRQLLLDNLWDEEHGDGGTACHLPRVDLRFFAGGWGVGTLCVRVPGTSGSQRENPRASRVLRD